MSRPPVEVRRAVVDDIDDLLALWAVSREELSRTVRAVAAPPPDQLRPRLRDSLTVSDAPVLIARYEGEPAGYAVLRLAPVLALDGTALHVDHLYVAPHLRRRGVARALLVAATSVAERNGADQVLAGAPPSARDTHRFLARLGFSPLVVRRVVGTAQLRRRLAGEGQRRGLDDLLSRRRSLRARAARAAAWAPAGWGGTDRGEEEPVPVPAAVPAPAAVPPSGSGPSSPVAASPVAASPVAASPVPASPVAASPVAASPVPPARGRGRGRGGDRIVVPDDAEPQLDLDGAGPADLTVEEGGPITPRRSRGR